jgi:bacterioferritin-associated ferredoxin
MGDSTPIRRCICHARTFAEVKELADANGWTSLEEIATGTGCGAGCGLCRPYLRRMLQTGETAFLLLPTEDVTG